MSEPNTKDQPLCCSSKAKTQPTQAIPGAKAYIDYRYCGANKDYCRPMQECPNAAIISVPDEKSGFGQRFVVDEEKCDGCGACVDNCCGDCIELIPPDPQPR